MILTRMTSFRIRPRGLPMMLILFIFLFKASLDGILNDSFEELLMKREQLLTRQDHYLLHRVVLNWVEEQLDRVNFGFYFLEY